MSYLKLSNVLVKGLKAAVLLVTLFLQMTAVYAGTPPSVEIVAIQPHVYQAQFNIQENNMAIKHCSAGLKNFCRPGEVVGSEAGWLFFASLIAFVFLVTKRKI